MFTIRGKQKFGAVWQDGRCLVTFKHGIATTDDPAVAEIMKAKGYTVAGEVPVVNSFAKMDKADLKTYAAEHGIDLTEVPDKKGDILAAIEMAEAKG